MAAKGKRPWLKPVTNGLAIGVGVGTAIGVASESAVTGFSLAAGLGVVFAAAFLKAERAKGDD